MEKLELVIKNGTVATAADVITCDIGISGGRIVAWAEKGQIAQYAIFATAAVIVIAIGILGYFTDFISSTTRIKVLSPIQVVTVIFTMITIMLFDIKLFKGA